jgi:hypothetical protein
VTGRLVFALILGKNPCLTRLALRPPRHAQVEGLGPRL